jgi:hypothetical protein
MGGCWRFRRFKEKWKARRWRFFEKFAMTLKKASEDSNGIRMKLESPKESILHVILDVLSPVSSHGRSRLSS